MTTPSPASRARRLRYSKTSGIEANSLGFAYNAPSVLAQINNFIANYRTSANVASVKADIVAHSMGGDVSRTMFLLSNFLTNTTFPTFGAGPINKLITIATPHLGTPVAADLLASNNACVRNVLASDSGLRAFVHHLLRANGGWRGGGPGRQWIWQQLEPCAFQFEVNAAFQDGLYCRNCDIHKPEWPELHLLHRATGESPVFEQSAGEGSDGHEVDHDLWAEQ